MAIPAADGDPAPGPDAEPGPGLGAERGSLVLMLAALFVALLALAGLVVDGGAKLDAAQNATAAAQEAARAGAGIVNTGQAYSTGRFSVDQSRAVAAAQQYLAGAGYRGVAVPAGRNSIRVTVTVRQPTRVLSLIGIDQFTVTETATAVLVTGVIGAGR